MKLLEFELYDSFRGLQSGFKINFNRPGISYNKIEPICLVGLNGSGKSNVMQVLAEIFFYLETLCIPRIQTYSNINSSFGFKIQYQIPVTPANFLDGDDSSDISSLTWRNVVVTKLRDEQPLFEYYYNSTEIKKISDVNLFQKLLPTQIIGYSSGMNEMISVPFAKMDFFYIDELLIEKIEQINENEEEPEYLPNSSAASYEPDIYRLFFLSYYSNAMAVLANYLFREWGDSNNLQEMDIINDILSIGDLNSFRITFNYKIREDLSIAELFDLSNGLIDRPDSSLSKLLKNVEVPFRLRKTLQNLIECSTSINIITEKKLNAFSKTDATARIEMYYKVDKNMKTAFRDKFPGGALKFFGEMYMLNMLNMDNYSTEIQNKVKQGQIETNIHDFLPKISDKEKVFNIDSINFKKKNNKFVKYKQLSDGEHQYLQVTGALMLIDVNSTLFLLDEPETHFNPEWRSKLISSLNQILEIKSKKEANTYIPQQEVILSTHSPFIVSDCRPEMIYIFFRNETNQFVEFKKPDFNTYGASVNLLTAKIFGKRETIAELVNLRLQSLKNDFERGIKDRDQILSLLNDLGDSIEKIIFIDTINQSSVINPTPL